MKAVLVSVSFITRVIVEDNATQEDIIDLARPRLFEKVQNELYANLESIDDDTECPLSDTELIKERELETSK